MQTSINSEDLSKQDTKRKGFSVEHSLRFAPQDAVISNSRFENVKNSKGKSQLFRALSCINKEINVKIDHKNQFKSPLNELNLDNFINKPSMSTSRLNSKFIEINDNVIQDIATFQRNSNKEQSVKRKDKQKGSKYVNKSKNNNNIGILPSSNDCNNNDVHTLRTSPLINDDDNNDDVIIINKMKTNHNNDDNTLVSNNNNNSTYTSNFITFLNTDNNNLNDNFVDLSQELNKSKHLSPIESEYYLNDKNSSQYEILKLFNDNTCMNYTFNTKDSNVNNNYKLCLLKDIDIKKILSLYDHRYCELNKIKKENERKKDELKVNYNRIDSINNRIVQLNNQLHDNDNEPTGDNGVDNNEHIGREFKSIFRETLMTNNALKEENEQLQRKYNEMLFQKETLKQKYTEDLLQYESLIKTLLTDNTNKTVNNNT